MPPNSKHSAKDVDDLVDSYEHAVWCISDPWHLSVGHVMFLMKTKKNFTLAADAEASLHGYTSAPPASLITKVSKNWKKMKEWRNRAQRHFDKIEQLLSSPFVLPEVCTPVEVYFI